MAISARKLLRRNTVSGGGIPASYSFSSSAILGGGFQNAVAISPFLDGDGNRPYVMAADISNVFYSTDKAQSWQPVGDIGSHNSAVLWSDVTPGRVYVAGDEGLWQSNNFGKTWSAMTRPANYDQDANGVYKVGGLEHPRSTGNMMAQDNSGATKYLWVATATKGVQRRDNSTWITSTVLTGLHLRSIASDPNNPDILYVAVSEDGSSATSGIYQSTNARGAMTFTKMMDYPPTVSDTSQYVEELFFIDDAGTSKLYVVGNNDGVFSYISGVWTALNSGIDTGSAPKWQCITGYKAPGGNIVLYVGCANGVQDTTSPKRRKVVMRSTNGGTTWSPITIASSSTITSNIYGTSINTWFGAAGDYLSFAGFNDWCGASLVVDPDRTDQLLLAGRAGAWIGTLSAGVWAWQPALNGIMATVNKTVATHPTDHGKVVWSNGDFNFFASTNHGTTVYHNPSGLPAVTVGDPKGDVAVYAPNGTVYLSSSPRGNNNTTDCSLASNTNPYSSAGTWVDEMVPSGVVNDMPALGVGQDASSNTVVLIGLNTNGLWRKTGSTWSHITGGPFNGPINNGCFRWVNGGPVVYAQDDSSGVWRSNSAGGQGSWVKIHNANATYNPSDTIAIDPINHSYLYISASNVLHRITNADTSTSTATTVSSTLSGISHVGSLAISQEGWLFVHDDNGDGSFGRLWRSLDPRATTPIFTLVSDNFYANACGTTKSLSIGVDGYIYTGDSGRGATVGTPQY